MRRSSPSRRCAYASDVAVDGLDALRRLREGAYDVVLMDMQMPQLDGLAATKRIRTELPEARQPWIMAVTANAMESDRRACSDAGMDDYLTKPLSLGELRAALERAGRSRARRAG